VDEKKILLEIEGLGPKRTPEGRWTLGRDRKEEMSPVIQGRARKKRIILWIY
jgi:hypothetical protein